MIKTHHRFNHSCTGNHSVEVTSNNSGNGELLEVCWDFQSSWVKYFSQHSFDSSSLAFPKGNTLSDHYLMQCWMFGWFQKQFIYFLLKLKLQTFSRNHEGLLRFQVSGLTDASWKPLVWITFSQLLNDKLSILGRKGAVATNRKLLQASQQWQLQRECSYRDRLFRTSEFPHKKKSREALKAFSLLLTGSGKSLGQWCASNAAT